MRDDWPTIERFVDEVDRATSPLDAVIKNLFMSIEARKCRQQAGVNVQDAVTVGFDEIARKKTHVAGQTDNIDTVFSKRGDGLPIVFLTRTSASLNHQRAQPALVRAVQTSSIALVADNQADLSTGDPLIIYSISQRNHV